MNRETYLELRRKDNKMGILFGAAKERKFTGDFMTLAGLFMSWPKSGSYKESLITQIINFYDTKFQLVLTFFNDKLIKID